MHPLSPVTRNLSPRILALDPGYDRLGIAVLEGTTLLFSKCFTTPKTLAFEERLQLVGKEVENSIKKYKPQALALETLFFAKNQKTALHVAEVRGMLIYIAMQHGLTLFEYQPSAIKIAVTGVGNADKKQVMAMIPRLINLEKEPKHDDEYDAIAVGITCIASERF